MLRRRSMLRIPGVELPRAATEQEHHPPGDHREHRHPQQQQEQGRRGRGVAADDGGRVGLLGVLGHRCPDLERHDEIELTPGAVRAVVVVEVAASLGALGHGQQLVAGLVRALLASEHVVELYADDDVVKRRIQDLGGAWIRGGRTST